MSFAQLFSTLIHLTDNRGGARCIKCHLRNKVKCNKSKSLIVVDVAAAGHCIDAPIFTTYAQVNKVVRKAK